MSPLSFVLTPPLKGVVLFKWTYCLLIGKCEKILSSYWLRSSPEMRLRGRRFCSNRKYLHSFPGKLIADRIIFKENTTNLFSSMSIFPLNVAPLLCYINLYIEGGM